MHLHISILYIVCVVAVVSGVLCYKRISKERIETQNNPLYTTAHLETFNTRLKEGDTLTYENSQHVPSTSRQPQTESGDHDQPIYDEIETEMDDAIGESDAQTDFYEMDGVIGEGDVQTKQVEVDNSNAQPLTSPPTAGHFADPFQRL